MGLRIVQVDAFTDRAFGGNPAAVCVLPEPRDAAWMQAVAREMNLSETAFLRLDGDRYRLRWFTPTVEVDLCGHATLAAGFIVMSELDRSCESIDFKTASGTLNVELTSNARLRMRLPSNLPDSIDPMAELDQAMGAA